MHTSLRGWRILFLIWLGAVAPTFGAGTTAQTIAFPGVAEKTYGDAPVTLAATASSGLPVSYAVVSGNGTIAGNVLTLTGGGTVVIEASQSGNDTYAAAAPVRQSVSVKPQVVTISVPSPTFVFTGFSQPIDAQITSNPALALNGNLDRLVVYYNGVPVNAPGGGTPTNSAMIALYPRSAGSYTVRAEAFSWMQRYVGSASGTVTITRMPVTITLGNLTQAYDGTPKPVAVTTTPTEVYYPSGAVPMTSYVKLTYNGSATPPAAAGTYEVVATVDGADVTGSARATLTITKSGQSQTISFGPIGGVHRVGETFRLNATASSGLPVTLQTTTPALATISGNDVTLRGVGTVTVRATQGGDDNFLAAPAVEQSFTAEQGLTKFTFAGLEQVYDGQPKYVTVTTDPAFAVFTGSPGPRRDLIFYDGDWEHGPVNAGRYTVVAKAPAGLDYGGSATATMTIRPAPATVTIANLAQTADGTPKAVAVTTQPPGLPTTVTYDGSTTPPQAAGSYAVVATISDRNYAGSATATLVVSSGGNSPTAGPSSNSGSTTPTPTAPPSPPLTPTGRVAQTIDFVLPAAQPVAAQTYPLGAVSSAGLPVAFVLVSGPAALDGNRLSFTGEPGTVVVRAVQSGNETTEPAEVTRSIVVAAAPVSRLANVSSRLLVSEGDAARTFITGFVIAGAEPQRVLIRAAGPALAAFGVEAALANPRLRLFDAAGRVLEENDDWSGNDVLAATGAVGAFPLTAGSRDAALVRTLAPGAYSVEVLARGGSGVALAEIFDASDPNAAVRPLVNLSTRGYVDAGEAQMGAGFVISGPVPKRVLVRAVGPALAGFGVANALPDPVLTVYRDTTVLAKNDDWQTALMLAGVIAPGDAAESAAAASASGAFPLPSGGKDSALVLTLGPGAYTAVVSGAGGASGVALVEVYDLR